MKRIFKWVCRIIEVIVIIYVLAITSLILARNKFGYTQIDTKTYISVTKNNVRDISGVKDKDLLIVDNVNVNNINVGDQLYYYATINDSYVVKTGFVSSKTADDTKAVYVLNDTDRTTVSSTRVIGKDIEVKSNIGGILTFLESRIGFLIFVLLPILVIFIYQIYDLIVAVKYDAKEEKEEPVKEIKQEEIPIPVTNEAQATAEVQATDSSSNDDIDMI